MGGTGSQMVKRLRHRSKGKRGGQVKQPVELEPRGMALQYPAYVESLAVRNYSPLTQKDRSSDLTKRPRLGWGVEQV